MPAGVAGCGALRELDLSDNLVAHAQGGEPFLGTPRLERLWLGGNRLLSVPADVCALPQLQQLHLEGNRLPALPEALGELRALRALHVGRNLLSALPRGLGQCRALEERPLVGRAVRPA